MKISFDIELIRHSRGTLKPQYPVLDAREIGDFIVVLYDHMAFPRGESARNLFAHEQGGEIFWRAEGIGQGATDGYTNFISELPLVVGNFSGFTCTIDIESGRVLQKVFTK